MSEMVNPGLGQAWWLALRPRTLLAGVVPVLVGTGVALFDGSARFLPAIAALAGSLWIQIGTNLVNDYADFERGADDDERLGPARAAQSGWISVERLRLAAAFAFGMAALVGIYLVWQGGWPILVLGALGLVCGWAYTAGPFPLGYRGLGDVLVFVFFGLFAVAGTHAVQARDFSLLALLAGVPVGALATLILSINNLRDREGDVRVGKRTLAVRLGESGARRFALCLLVGSYAFLPVLRLAGAPWLACVLPLLSLPLAWPLAVRIQRESGPALNECLAAAARLEAVYGALLFAGFWIGR